jgi:cytochrome bd ubiquinol oxidase subunit II
VPPTLTIAQAAAAPSSQMFLLIGTLVLLPLIIGYFVLVHWLFRGKVREGEGY